jgi:hypothetical protein
MAVLPARSRAEFKTGTRCLVEFAAERLATGASTPLDRRGSCDGCVRVGLARAVAPTPKIDPLKRFGGATRVSDLSQVNALSLASWFN